MDCLHRRFHRRKIEGELSLDEIDAELFPEDPPIRMGPPGINKPAHPDLEILEGGPEHYSVGKAGDGVVYLNDDGEWVKLNSRGHPYRIDERGFRRISGTPGPFKIYSKGMAENVPPMFGKGSPKPRRRRLRPKWRGRKARRRSRRVKAE